MIENMVNFYLFVFLIFIKFLYSRSFSKYLFPHIFTGKFRIHSHGNGLTLNMIDHASSQKEKIPPFFDLVEILDRFNTSSYKINDLINQITNIGWVSTNDIILFSKDFTSRPEVLTDILQKDFSFKAIDAHLIRSALFSLINEKNKNTDKSMTSTLHNSLTTNDIDDNNSNNEKGNYKQLKLTPRKFLSKDKIYGILNNTDLFPLLSSELNEFFIFMTEPNVQSSDPPVRKATAEVGLII